MAPISYRENKKTKTQVEDQNLVKEAKEKKEMKKHRLIDAYLCRYTGR